MAGKGSLVSFGPFAGGLNERVGDNAGSRELADAQNIFLDDNGYIRPRPGVQVLYSTVTGGSAWDPSSGTHTSVALLGSIYKPSDNTEWVYFCVRYSASTEVWCTNNPTDPASYVKVVTFASIAEIRDLCTYFDLGLVVRHDGPGMYFPVVNTGAVATFTTLPAMPTGDRIFAFKERIFVVDYDNSKIYWSKATDPNTWAAPDGGFVTVAADLADKITDVVIYNNLIYIFKNNSSHVFAFTDDPAIDGFITDLNSGMGGRPYLWNDQLLLAADDGRLYRVSGAQFIDVAPQMQFGRSGNVDTVTPVEFNGLLHYGFTEAGLTKYYVANIVQNTWAKWTPGNSTTQGIVVGKSARSFNGSVSCKVIAKQDATGTYLSMLRSPDSSEPESYYLLDEAINKETRVPHHLWKTGLLGENASELLTRFKKFKRGWARAAWFGNLTDDTIGLKTLIIIDNKELLGGVNQSNVTDFTPGQNSIQYLKIGLFRYKYIQIQMETYVNGATYLPPTSFTGWTNNRFGKTEYFFSNLVLETTGAHAILGTVAGAPR